MASHDPSDPSARRCAATSGRAQAICCTWTPSAMRALSAPAMPLTGVRDRTGAEKDARWGYQWAHCIVDDHSRLAYVELHDDERAGTVTGFVERALCWFGARGIVCRRLMTDGAWTYTRNRSLADLLAKRGVRHLVTRPYRPQTTARWSASTRRWPASGRTGCSTSPTATARGRCDTGWATTTSGGPTAPSAARLRSVAFGTYVGRTARPPPSAPRRRRSPRPARVRSRRAAPGRCPPPGGRPRRSAASPRRCRRWRSGR